MDLQAQIVRILGEFAGFGDQDALLDIVQDLLVAAFIADEQHPAAVFLHHLEHVLGHIGLGVAAPGFVKTGLAEAQFSQFDRQFLHVVVRVGQGVVIEEDLFHFRHFAQHVGDFFGDFLGRAVAEVVAADGLWPQAESATALAAAPGVKTDIGVALVAAEIFGAIEIALIDRRDHRQHVHVLNDRAVLVADQCAIGAAPGYAVDFGQRFAFGQFDASEIVFLAADEIDGIAGV